MGYVDSLEIVFKRWTISECNFKSARAAVVGLHQQLLLLLLTAVVRAVAATKRPRGRI